MRDRLRRVLFRGAAVLILGGAYTLWLTATDLGIPCVFRLVTGFKCPGCGVSGMLLSLMRLDFKAAFGCNPVLLCLTPLLAALLTISVVRYVRTGKHAMTKAENAAVLFSVAVLLFWGVVRNLPRLPFGPG